MKIKYEGTLVAKTPIFHGGDEKTGSTPVLRTITIYNDKRNTFEIIPYISGNSIRGKLRRLAFADLFERVQYTPPLKLHHILYSGGVLEGVEDSYGAIDLELRRKIRATLPLLSLFGASVGNQVLSGKLLVGHAFPICFEYSDFLPVQLQEHSSTQYSVRLFTGDSFITRRAEIPRQSEDEEAVQMKVDYECFVPGTSFFHWFALDYATDLELSCWGHVMSLFRDSPYLGGRSSQGDGVIEMDYQPSPNSSEMYLAFIDGNKSAIIEMFDFLATKKEQKNEGIFEHNE